MILVDTNVVSEPLRGAPEPSVAEWLDAQALETLYLSAITVAELRSGVRALPAGRRRDRLHEDLERQVLPMFAGRVLAFDLPASQAYWPLSVNWSLMWESAKTPSETGPRTTLC